MESKHGLGWAAGFFEGEGYVGFNYTLNKKYNKQYPRLTLSIAQIHRAPLDKFCEVVGLGKVRGPYGPYSANRQAHYQFLASGSEASRIIDQLLPYLFSKGEQARWALLNYEEYLNGRP